MSSNKEKTKTERVEKRDTYPDAVHIAEGDAVHIAREDNYGRE